MGHTLYQLSYTPSCKITLYLSSVTGEELWQWYSVPATLAPHCLPRLPQHVKSFLRKFQELDYCLDVLVMFAFDKQVPPQLLIKD